MVGKIQSFPRGDMMLCTCKYPRTGWKGLGIPSDKHVYKGEILSNSLEFEFGGGGGVLVFSATVRAIFYYKQEQLC